MKKRLLTTCIGLITTLTLFSQTWITQTSGTVNDLWGVSFVNAVDGWASGAAGTILVTTDGGTTWNPQTSGVSVPILRNIEMFNTSLGWTVGDNGTILNTANGGVNWNPQTSGLAVTLRQPSFATATDGWICGASGTIIHTTDGGTTWNPQTSGTVIGLMCIDFVDINNGWAVGSSGAVTQGIILHTTDGGSTWNQQTAPNATNLNTVSFSSLTNGWAAGNGGTIFNTTDGGTNWTLQTNPSANAIRGIHFVTNTDGFAAGDAGSIVNTTDGGANWNTQVSGTAQILRHTDFVNAKRGYAVGVAGTIVFYNIPVITTTASLNPFTTIAGTPSAPQSFTVSGINLIANMNITAPTDFEVSLSPGFGFGAMVTIPPTATVVSNTTIYVRYNPAIAGTHSGNVTVATTGATTQNIAVSGTSTFAGINETSAEYSIRVYPNPVTDYLQLQSNNNNMIRNIEMSDLSGKIVLQLKDVNTTQYTISTVAIPSGIYMVKLYTDNGNHTKKIIVN